MKHKIPDILFMGFVCMFFFVAIGGIWGFIVNWIIFGWLAYEQKAKYTYSPLGVRERLLSGYWKKYIDEYVHDGSVNCQATGMSNYDWQVYGAANSIVYYIENRYKGYKNISNKNLTIVSKVNEMLTGNIACTPDGNAPYCARYVDGEPWLSFRKKDPNDNKMKEVLLVHLTIYNSKRLTTRVVPWYEEWCKTHTVV